MSVSADEFRALMRSWASGVTIVTARDGDRTQGMTVSAFSSVSAEPPALMVCLNRATLTHDLVTASKLFAVHILGREQRELAVRFSTPTEQSRFESLAYKEGTLGLPLLYDALACFECRVLDSLVVSSHTLFIGEVVAGESRSGEPLAYFDGDYRRVVREE